MTQRSRERSEKEDDKVGIFGLELEAQTLTQRGGLVYVRQSSGPVASPGWSGTELRVGMVVFQIVHDLGK